MQKDTLEIHTDGGSRGNPGHAASGFVVEMNGAEIYSGSKYLGIQTNNVAEYTAVIIALEWLFNQKLITNNYSLITFYLDSELVVKQIKGLYKVKDENLKNLYFQVVELINKLPVKVNFIHILREKNKIADLLVNQELDKNN